MCGGKWQGTDESGKSTNVDCGGRKRKSAARLIPRDVAFGDRAAHAGELARVSR